MVDIVWWLVGKIGDYFNVLNGMVLFTYGGRSITVLGLLVALALMAVFIKLLLPRT